MGLWRISRAQPQENSSACEDLEVGELQTDEKARRKTGDNVNRSWNQHQWYAVLRTVCDYTFSVILLIVALSLPAFWISVAMLEGTCDDVFEAARECPSVFSVVQDSAAQQVRWDGECVEVVSVADVLGAMESMFPNDLLERLLEESYEGVGTAEALAAELNVCFSEPRMMVFFVLTWAWWVVALYAATLLGARASSKLRRSTSLWFILHFSKVGQPHDKIMKSVKDWLGPKVNEDLCKNPSDSLENASIEARLEGFAAFCRALRWLVQSALPSWRLGPQGRQCSLEHCAQIFLPAEKSDIYDFNADGHEEELMRLKEREKEQQDKIDAAGKDLESTESETSKTEGALMRRQSRLEDREQAADKTRRYLENAEKQLAELQDILDDLERREAQLEGDENALAVLRADRKAHQKERDKRVGFVLTCQREYDKDDEERSKAAKRVKDTEGALAAMRQKKTQLEQEESDANENLTLVQQELASLERRKAKTTPSMYADIWRILQFFFLVISTVLSLAAVASLVAAISTAVSEPSRAEPMPGACSSPAALVAASPAPQISFGAFCAEREEVVAVLTLLESADGVREEFNNLLDQLEALDAKSKRVEQRDGFVRQFSRRVAVCKNSNSKRKLSMQLRTISISLSVPSIFGFWKYINFPLTGGLARAVVLWVYAVFEFFKGALKHVAAVLKALCWCCTARRRPPRAQPNRPRRKSPAPYPKPQPPTNRPRTSSDPSRSSAHPERRSSRAQSNGSPTSSFMSRSSHSSHSPPKKTGPSRLGSRLRDCALWLRRLFARLWDLLRMPCPSLPHGFPCCSPPSDDEESDDDDSQPPAIAPSETERRRSSRKHRCGDGGRCDSCYCDKHTCIKPNGRCSQCVCPRHSTTRVLIRDEFVCPECFCTNEDNHEKHERKTEWKDGRMYCPKCMCMSPLHKPNLQRELVNGKPVCLTCFCVSDNHDEPVAREPDQHGALHCPECECDLHGNLPRVLVRDELVCTECFCTNEINHEKHERKTEWKDGVRYCRKCTCMSPLHKPGLQREMVNGKLVCRTCFCVSDNHDGFVAKEPGRHGALHCPECTCMAHQPYLQRELINGKLICTTCFCVSKAHHDTVARVPGMDGSMICRKCTCMEHEPGEQRELIGGDLICKRCFCVNEANHKAPETRVSTDGALHCPKCTCTDAGQHPGEEVQCIWRHKTLACPRCFCEQCGRNFRGYKYCPKCFCQHGTLQTLACNECMKMPKLLTRKRVCKLTALLYASRERGERDKVGPVTWKDLFPTISRKGTADTIGPLDQERFAVSRNAYFLLGKTIISLLIDAAAAKASLRDRDSDAAVRTKANRKAMKGIVGYDAWEVQQPVFELREGGRNLPIGSSVAAYDTNLKWSRTLQSKNLTDLLTAAYEWMQENWNAAEITENSPWHDVVTEGDLAELALIHPKRLPSKVLKLVLTPMEMAYVNDARAGLKWAGGRTEKVCVAAGSPDLDAKLMRLLNLAKSVPTAQQVAFDPTAQEAIRRISGVRASRGSQPSAEMVAARPDFDEADDPDRR